VTLISLIQRCAPDPGPSGPGPTGVGDTTTRPGYVHTGEECSSKVQQPHRMRPTYATVMVSCLRQ
jgi:hypothetical protein